MPGAFFVLVVCLGGCGSNLTSIHSNHTKFHRGVLALGFRGCGNRNSHLIGAERVSIIHPSSIIRSSHPHPRQQQQRIRKGVTMGRSKHRQIKHNLESIDADQPRSPHPTTHITSIAEIDIDHIADGRPTTHKAAATDHYHSSNPTRQGAMVRFGFRLSRLSGAVHSGGNVAFSPDGNTLYSIVRNR